MFHKYRIVSMISIALFCALAVFAFSSTTTLAAQRPVPGTPAAQKPPTQQQRPSAQKLVCPATVRLSNRGDAVKKLQNALNKQGFRGPQNRVLRVNGIFGNETLVALKNFQARHHLKVDGVAEPDVWRLLGQCNMR
jgi:peptidoglycan hydrolase-like protein with peptidoglycan-binding domain